MCIVCLCKFVFVLSYVFAINIYISYHTACKVEAEVKFQCHQCLFGLSIWLGSLRKLLHFADTFTFKSLRCTRAVYVWVSYIWYYGNIILGQNNPLTDFRHRQLSKDNLFFFLAKAKSLCLLFSQMLISINHAQYVSFCNVPLNTCWKTVDFVTVWMCQPHIPILIYLEIIYNLVVQGSNKSWIFLVWFSMKMELTQSCKDKSFFVCTDMLIQKQLFQIVILDSHFINHPRNARIFYCCPLFFYITANFKDSAFLVFCHIYFYSDLRPFGLYLNKSKWLRA